MIPFNRVKFMGNEMSYLNQAIANGQISGNGIFTRRAERILNKMHQGGVSLLTTSGTHALELAARLLDLKPGDEIIVPAYTFVSTASAFLWNGAKPVFADVREDTLNIDLESAKSCISARTKAICIVHYGGVGAEPDKFAELCQEHDLVLIEDNSHGLGATYQDQVLGTFGALSTLSFHETKNVTCGEGGALVINEPSLVERAEILREKGTDRSKFLRNQVDKYTWLDEGSSWVMSELLAGVLLGQLEQMQIIARKRTALWEEYQVKLRSWAFNNSVLLPFTPDSSRHSAHMFHLRFSDLQTRDRFIHHMRSRGVLTVFHYQSLASSPKGLTLQTEPVNCPNSERASSTLVRLPIFFSMTSMEQSAVIQAVLSFSTANSQ